MNRLLTIFTLGLFTLLSVGVVHDRADAGQEAIVRLEYLIKSCHAIAVVEVTDVTKVDVPLDRGQITSVYVAQAVVEEHIKSDRYPVPRNRTIAIVGSTRPMSSAVWKPIRKQRYLAFLTGEQGHFRYGFNAAFREIDDRNNVGWYEYTEQGRPPEFSRVPVKHAIKRIREVQKELAKETPSVGPPQAAKTAERALLRAQGLVDVSAKDCPEPLRDVIRDVKSLAELLGVDDAQAAIDQVAAGLNIETVDFDHEMLIALSAGPIHGREALRNLSATQFSAKDNAIHVEWTIQRTMGRADAPLVHPVRFLMATRFDGEVVIHAPTESLR